MGIKRTKKSINHVLCPKIVVVVVVVFFSSLSNRLAAAQNQTQAGQGTDVVDIKEEDIFS